LMVIVSAGGIALTLRFLGMPPSRVATTGAVYMLAPVPIYLSFKLMGEVPSVLLATLAAAIFAAGLPRSMIGLFSIAAGAVLGLSGTAGWTGPALFLGFWLALPWGVRPGLRRRLLLNGLVATMVGLLTMSVVLPLLGGSLTAYGDGLLASMVFTKPLPVWLFALFNIGLAGMGLWLLLPLAALSPDARARHFFAMWLVLSAVPAFILAAGFFEPRYLVGAAAPLAGLAALGIEAAGRHAHHHGWSGRRRLAVAVAAALLVVGGTASAQPFMPYESDLNSLLEIIQTQAASDSVAILLPWNYSEFHLLRFIYPEKAIYLVQSAATEQGDRVDDPAWTDRYARMYGSHYLPSAEALSRLRQTRLLYIGFTIMPSIQNLQTAVSAAGLGPLAAFLANADLRNHLIESWIWQNPRFQLLEVAEYGQYRVYEVKAASPAVAD
jgi:hypothetical protein